MANVLVRVSSDFIMPRIVAARHRHRHIAPGLPGVLLNTMPMGAQRTNIVCVIRLKCGGVDSGIMVLKKRILIIAGPNGAGKTTFAREFLLREARCPNFINADLIALGISPLAPEAAAAEAARIMLERMDKLTAIGKSFAFETTLAGRTYVHRIREWRAAGYEVKIVFLRLPLC